MYDNYIQPAHRSTHIYHTTSTTSSRLIGQLTTSSPLIGQLRSTTPTISSRLIGQLTTSSPLIGQLRSTTSTTSSRLIGQLTTSSPLIGQLRTTTPRPLHPARSSVNSYLPHHLHYIQPSHWPAHYIQPAHWSAQIHHATPTTSSRAWSARETPSCALSAPHSAYFQLAASSARPASPRLSRPDLLSFAVVVVVSFCAAAVPRRLLLASRHVGLHFD